MESSAGQALSGIREQPSGEVTAPLLDQASVDAARLTGFVAVLSVLLGLSFSVLLPETRTPRMMGAAAPPSDLACG
jgi:hypothetical protein